MYFCIKNTMSEELFITDGADKKVAYETLLPQLMALIEGETDLVAKLANISAALKETFSWWWVGFYLVKKDELVLGPFQGTVACTRIKFGKGVCGTAWKNEKSMLISDVNTFDGHIACSSRSVSEIVVPIIEKNGQVIGVLDIDSERFNELEENDVFYLEKISQLITDSL